MVIVLIVLSAVLAAGIVALAYRLRAVSAAQRVTERSADEARRALESVDVRARRSDEVIERLGEGVVIFNDVGLPTAANAQARALLGLHGPLPATLPSEEISALVRSVLAGDDGASDIVELRVPERRSLAVRAAPLASGGAVAALHDASQELRAERTRRGFVAHASHELRTPVADIHALAEALASAIDDDPAAARRFAGKLVDDARRMARLIEDLLDLSRLEDPGSIALGIADLSEVARREVDAARAAATTKGLALDAAIEPDLKLRGHDDQLGLMLRNLLDNAIRYTPSGSVALDAGRSDGEIVVRITDDGIGIPLSAQARVFERFYRVDEARSRDRGGTGLGLAIVKHVAELHGGHVELSSIVGEGSTFTVRLPETQ